MQRSHAVVAVLALAVSACSDLQSRNPGQTSFESAPSWGVPADLITPARPASPGYAPRAPIYRLEGNRLYLLNGYRGLLVFDVTDIDHPRLIGRSSIAGWPVEMVVRNGIATVVLADWYGQDDDGTPFYGSLIRGLDATDAAHIRTLGDARLAGWIREARVVGDVLHTVSHPVEAIWDRVRHIEAPAIMVVSSVNFAGGTVRKMAERSYPGSVVVAIHANVNAILVARGSATSAAAPIRLTYLDISDQTGILVERGSIDVPGLSSLDFSDGKTARAFYCDQGCRSTAQNWHLALVDFSNPDSPVQASQLAGESAAAAPTAGSPSPVQGDMQVEAQLVSHGLYCGDLSRYKDPRATRHRTSATEWRLLLQIDLGRRGRLMWGDAGRISFWLRREDLAALKFRT